MRGSVQTARITPTVQVRVFVENLFFDLSLALLHHIIRQIDRDLLELQQAVTFLSIGSSNKE